MPVVEIVWFSASDSLKADRSLINPALDHISKVEGCMNIYYGVAEEDKEMVYVAIVWETYEHHKALMDHPNYPSLTNKIKPNVGASGMKMNHVEFKGDYSAAFNSPTTQFTTAKAKEGKNQEEFKTAMKAIGDLIISAGHPVTFGQAREEQGKIFIVVGWESAKAHSEFVSGEKFVQPLQNVQKVGDIQVLHVNLIKYT